MGTSGARVRKGRDASGEAHQACSCRSRRTPAGECGDSHVRSSHARRRRRDDGLDAFAGDNGVERRGAGRSERDRRDRRANTTPAGLRAPRRRARRDARGDRECARGPRPSHRRAHTPATPATPAPTKTGSDSTSTTLDLIDNTGDTSEWAKRALRTLNVVLGQCEDLGRAEDPNLAGTIAVEFTLVGEPNVGGLLERAEIVDADTTITQQTIRDCLTQQLYALELVPPPDGVTVRREIHLQVP
jgi:hypothetical protein